MENIFVALFLLHSSLTLYLDKLFPCILPLPTSAHTLLPYPPARPKETVVFGPHIPRPLSGPNNGQYGGVEKGASGL